MPPEIFWSCALGYGAFLSAVMTVLIVGSLRLDAEAWVGDYPPDIREAYGEISARGRRHKLYFGVVILLAPVAAVAALLIRLHELSGATLGFGQAAAATFVTLTVFNMFDLLIIDWLLFVRLQPRFVVLPGTEGMAGYRDYLFHFRAFLIGLVVSAAGALAAAAVYRLLT